MATVVTRPSTTVSKTVVELLNFLPATDYGTPTSRCGDDIESDNLLDATSCARLSGLGSDIPD